MPREKPGYKPICFYVEAEKHKELKIKAVQADIPLSDYIADIVLNVVDGDNGDTQDIEGDCCQFLKELLNGKKPKNGLIVKVAHLLDVRPEKLKELQERYIKGSNSDVEVAAMP
ncbi:MAG: hypothetical protein ACKPH7_27260 [Planktothrix sp.]|uniref:hypothetical protein n=1 Tax=Planktothrix sp. TaxID=3088171 RepID=UPI0038D3A5FC